ncbi:MAG: hypothetical protein H6Q90_2136 [Deltaproteobacteria bacterium]|nr:hypothetical protein [Deltaproteobacteria bacterium]
MTYEFLSDPWFQQIEQLIAAAGDLKIPEPMKVAVNVTIKSPKGETHLFINEGLFTRGHQPGVDTMLTLDAGLARKLFVDGDMVAGVQAFLAGEVTVEGDLAKVVAMQTVEPSEPQKQLTVRIAAITA